MAEFVTGAQPALAATVHDPRGALLPAIDRHGGDLGRYRAVYVCATEETDRRVTAALADRGVTVGWQPAGVPGTSRRRAVELALTDGQPSLLYVDLDRWLHWSGRFPAELARLPERIVSGAPGAWYVCLGRTERAFATHPEVQQVAERATNRAFSLAIGRPIDATAGGCWLTRDGADLIVSQSVERTLGTDLEWPALIWRLDPGRLATVSVEGLEFESAAFATEAIAAAGGEAAWIERVYQTPAMWRQRLRLAADSVAALERALSR